MLLKGKIRKFDIMKIRESHGSYGENVMSLY